MTTAHRPTWAPAKGNDEQGGYRLFVPSAAVSAKDLPGHTKLKFRYPLRLSERTYAERMELEQRDKTQERTSKKET